MLRLLLNVKFPWYNYVESSYYDNLTKTFLQRSLKQQSVFKWLQSSQSGSFKEHNFIPFHSRILMLLFGTDYFKSKQLKPGNLRSLSFSLFNHIICSCSDPSKDHFIVVFLVAKPLIQSEAVIDLVVLEISTWLA